MLALSCCGLSGAHSFSEFALGGPYRPLSEHRSTLPKASSLWVVWCRVRMLARDRVDGALEERLRVRVTP